MENEPTGYGAAVDAIYSAVEAPEKWLDALKAIADCTGDVGAIFIYPREDGSMATVVTPGLEAVQAQFQSLEWATRDLRYERALERGYVASGACVTDRHVASDEEVESHPYYVELLRPHGLKYFAGLVVSSSAPAALSVQRGPDKPPFSDEELAVVSRLGKHVEAALRIGVRLAAAERRVGGENYLSRAFADLGEGQGAKLSAMLARLAKA